MEKTKYWLWFTSLRGLGPRAQQKLLETVGGPEQLWRMDRQELSSIPELTAKEACALSDKQLTEAERILCECEREHISIMTMDDSAYPERLRQIDTAPPVLYYRGTFLPFDELPAVSVIGSRNASEAGLTAAGRMGWEIASCGGTVISGAAKGIDSRALEGALLAGKPVAAVLGNGLDIVYPAQAKQLYHDIAANGCLISEFAPGTKPYAGNFPRRNRIMSGLSLGLLVVEAAKKSGTLITVNYALEQGRDVFAMPGSVGIDSCEGSNALLQEGAGFALNGWDVMREYSLQYPELVQQNLKPMPKPKPVPKEKTAEKSSRNAGSGASSTAAEQTDGSKKPEAFPKNSVDNGNHSNYIDLQQIKTKLTPDEAAIVDAIGSRVRQVDEIIAEVALPPAKVLSCLTLLEVKGVLRQQPGKLFSLKL